MNFAAGESGLPCEISQPGVADKFSVDYRPEEIDVERKSRAPLPLGNGPEYRATQCRVEHCRKNTSVHPGGKGEMALVQDHFRAAATIRSAIYDQSDQL